MMTAAFKTREREVEPVLDEYLAGLARIDAHPLVHVLVVRDRRYVVVGALSNSSVSGVVSVEPYKCMTQTPQRLLAHDRNLPAREIEIGEARYRIWVLRHEPGVVVEHWMIDLDRCHFHGGRVVLTDDSPWWGSVEEDTTNKHRQARGSRQRTAEGK